jgi:formylglycine-generating enzyme required for sulfatase activity
VHSLRPVGPALALGCALACPGCHNSPAAASDSAPIVTSLKDDASAAQATQGDVDAAPDAPQDSLVDARAADVDGGVDCPSGMVWIPGGVEWMGTDFDVDEAPRHQVAVRDFCIDRTEVTVRGYQECVESGKCAASHDGPGCTGHAKVLQADHPITCVDWNQALAACGAWGKRLPTEREWEYAASGGPERRRYSWGIEDPEGRSCYNQRSTCAVGSYPPGAFGLHDMSGNVWEWTGSWFGPYPDEYESGMLRVYRGGSYSRRFPRWMRTGLRNRYRPGEYGAHLGFRCAQDRPGAQCPAPSTPSATGCEMPGTLKHRSAAAPGAVAGPLAPGSAEVPPPSIDRDPRFDDDCLKYKPGRPICYKIAGGSFADRQKLSGSRGCVNRDVGIGYNSICCTQ